MIACKPFPSLVPYRLADLPAHVLLKHQTLKHDAQAPEKHRVAKCSSETTPDIPQPMRRHELEKNVCKGCCIYISTILAHMSTFLDIYLLCSV